MKYILSLEDIVNVTNAELICGNKETKCEDFKIDSRLIENGNKVDDNLEKETVNKENFTVIEDGLNLVEI